MSDQPFAHKCASRDFECPQPSGESVAARDQSDRCQGDTPPSGERTRDVSGQAGRSDGQSPTRPSDTNSVGSKCASAQEKSVALVTDVLGPMGKPCPVCRGGWWYEGGCLVAGVHAKDCPHSDEEPSL